MLLPCFCCLLHTHCRTCMHACTLTLSLPILLTHVPCARLRWHARTASLTAMPLPLQPPSHSYTSVSSIVFNSCSLVCLLIDHPLTLLPSHVLMCSFALVHTHNVIHGNAPPDHGPSEPNVHVQHLHELSSSVTFANQPPLSPTSTSAKDNNLGVFPPQAQARRTTTLVSLHHLDVVARGTTASGADGHGPMCIHSHK